MNLNVFLQGCDADAEVEADAGIGHYGSQIISMPMPIPIPFFKKKPMSMPMLKPNCGKNFFSTMTLMLSKMSRKFRLPVGLFRFHEKKKKRLEIKNASLDLLVEKNCEFLSFKADRKFHFQHLSKEKIFLLFFFTSNSIRC